MSHFPAGRSKRQARYRHEQPCYSRRAALSLEGLSVGDAFGERFFSWSVEEMAPQRVAPPGPWLYTDDTEMALSLVSVLRQSGEIDQDRLARSFSEHYDPQRGYGPAMHDLVPMMWLPGSWVSLSRRLFGGQGSFGNGAAMRVAPGIRIANSSPPRRAATSRTRRLALSRSATWHSKASPAFRWGSMDAS